MKKALAIITLLLISSGAMAQREMYVYQNDTTTATPKYMYYEDMSEDEMINNINMININLKKFAKLQVGGEVSMIAGTAIIAGSSIYYAYSQESFPTFGFIVGGAFTLGGYIAKMYSFSKLNKVQIRGSSIIYKF